MQEKEQHIGVDILMATYNGEKYIENQLLSLLQQTFKNWRLLIHDDGSVDKTVEIIKKYLKIDKRIFYIEDEEHNQGAGKNFWGLLKHANATYVMFCDQDDLWFEKKVEKLVNVAENSFDNDKPSLVYCDAYAYSEKNGEILSNSVSHFHARELNEFLFFNSGYQGCSMLFNRALLEIAKRYEGTIFLHDDVISLMAHSFGTVYFLPKSLMFYRQHNENVTGGTNLSFFDIMKSFFRKNSFVLSRRHYEEKREFFLQYSDDLNATNRTLFKEYLRYPSLSVLSRVLLILANNFSLGGYHLPLIVKTVMRRPLE